MKKKMKLPSKAKLDRYARKYLNILGMKGPLPVIRIVDQKVWSWLARTLVIPGNPRSIIEIQKAATIHDETLERIVAHEVIHHFTHTRMHVLAQLLSSLVADQTDNHGKEFLKYARIINKAVGRRGFVTGKYNNSYTIAPKGDKIWLLIVRRFDMQVGFCWTDRPNDRRVKAMLEKMSALPNASGKFIETSSMDFITGPRVEEESIAVPFGPDSKKSLALLKKLYETSPAESLVMFFDNTVKSSDSVAVN